VDWARSWRCTVEGCNVPFMQCSWQFAVYGCCARLTPWRWACCMVARFPGAGGGCQWVATAVVHVSGGLLCLLLLLHPVNVCLDVLSCTLSLMSPCAVLPCPEQGFRASALVSLWVRALGVCKIIPVRARTLRLFDSNMQSKCLRASQSNGAANRRKPTAGLRGAAVCRPVAAVPEPHAGTLDMITLILIDLYISRALIGRFCACRGNEQARSLAGIHGGNLCCSRRIWYYNHAFFSAGSGRGEAHHTTCILSINTSKDDLSLKPAPWAQYGFARRMLL